MQFLLFVIFWIFLKKKAANLLLQHLKKNTLKKNSLTHHFISIYFVFSLQRIYWRCSSNTHTHAHTNTHIDFHLLWHWTLSTIKHILFFLVAFIKHMQYKKSSSLVDIKNFSKTKGLNSKRQKTTSIQSRAKENVFPEMFFYRVI